MKLVFAEYNCLPIVQYEPENWVILNFNSYLEGYERVNLLMPSHTTDIVNPIENKNYDIQYANFILSNDIAFMELMKIIMPLYAGKNVLVLISKNELFEYMSESLMKFIQSRYGLVPSILNEVDDYEYVEDTSFNIFGVSNLDADKERFTYLYASANPHVLRF